MRALLSVSDKRGIVEFARALVALGYEIVSTGGTAEALRQGGVAVVPIEMVTGFPEMMDGRVKTLHPKVHGGLLARRGHAGDERALKEHGITPIDLVAVNLYPFRETVAKPETTFEQAIEHIDIGGPSMLRSAAKNHERVVVVVDPDDYPKIIAALRAGSLTPGASPGLRRDLAAKVFAHTAAYDATIVNYLTRTGEELPAALTLILERRQALRYGENPHQRAALYATDEARGIRELVQHHGKELSFNNLLDVDAAVSALVPWADRPACVHRPGRHPRRGLHARPRHRPHVGVRIGGGVQHGGGPGGRRSDARAIRRSGRRPTLSRRRARGLSREEESAGGRAPPSRGGARLGLQAHPRRLPRAGPLSPRRRGRRDGVEGRDQTGAVRGRMARSAVRLGRRGGGQIERDPPGQGRGGDRDRRGADVAGGRVVPRRPQGAPAGLRSRGCGPGERRVLS
ncbi:MAG: hypothetical protein DMD71_12475, partial [Gemmatimonadetes bacterium]